MLTDTIQSSLLHHYPMLSRLPLAEQEALWTQAMPLTLPAGTVVFDEDQPCQGFPLILQGGLRVIKAAPNGRELQLYRVLPGESCILTSSCLLGHSAYEARGLCEQDTQMVLLPATVFHTLLASQPVFRDYVFHLFAERLTGLMQLVTAVAFQKLDQRLAALLLAKDNPIRATHQALANELGSAREMVSRLLKGFADQGWLTLGREHIEIINREGLRRLAAS